MIERCLEMKDALILYFVEHKIDKSDILSEEDWSLLEELKLVLRPLYQATNELSAEKFTTLSNVVPMVNSLLQAYAPKNDKSESETAKKCRSLIHESLKAKFNDIETNEIYTNSCLFDPRYKNVVFTSKLKAQKAVEAAKKDAIENLEELEVNESDDNASESGEETDELWGNFEANAAKFTKRSKNVDHRLDCIELEMKKYLSIPKIDRKSCPIKWWNNIGRNQFPFLFAAAKKYLCMPATSVASERIFSRAGAILNKKRSALDKQHANMLITLNTNMK